MHRIPAHRQTAARPTSARQTTARQNSACQTLARQASARQTLARQTSARQTSARPARQTTARQTTARHTTARQTTARHTKARQTTAQALPSPPALISRRRFQQVRTKVHDDWLTDRPSPPLAAAIVTAIVTTIVTCVPASCRCVFLFFFLSVGMIRGLIDGFWLVGRLYGGVVGTVGRLSTRLEIGCSARRPSCGR